MGAKIYISVKNHTYPFFYQIVIHRKNFNLRLINRNVVSYFLFEVLELCPIDILREREQHYIDTFSRTHKLYNVRLSVIPSGEKGKRETQKVDTNLLNKVRQIIAITKQTVGGFIDLAIEEKIKKQKQKQSS